MRGMTVSQATTVVTTTGNSNGFHLDSTHSSIRGRAGKGEGGEWKNGTERSSGLNRRQVCVSMHMWSSITGNVHFMHIYMKGSKEVVYISKGIKEKRGGGLRKLYCLYLHTTS